MPPKAAIVAPPLHPAMVLPPPGAACSFTLGISCQLNNHKCIIIMCQLTPMVLSATPPTQWVREGLAPSTAC